MLLDSLVHKGWFKHDIWQMHQNPNFTNPNFGWLWVYQLFTTQTWPGRIQRVASFGSLFLVHLLFEIHDCEFVPFWWLSFSQAFDAFVFVELLLCPSILKGSGLRNKYRCVMPDSNHVKIWPTKKIGGETSWNAEIHAYYLTYKGWGDQEPEKVMQFSIANQSV